MDASTYTSLEEIERVQEAERIELDLKASSEDQDYAEQFMRGLMFQIKFAVLKSEFRSMERIRELESRIAELEQR